MTVPKLPSRAQFAVWFVLPLLVLCLGLVYYSTDHQRLEIVAAAEGCDQHPCQMSVKGRIHSAENAPLDGAMVWVDARTSSGDRVVRFATVDKTGSFEITDIPGEVRRRNLVRLTVVATNKGDSAAVKVLDENLLSIPVIFALITIIFGANLFLAFHKGDPGQPRYVAALTFACLFTGVMVVGLALGLRHASTTGAKDPIRLPFGSVVWGTFDKNVKSEWLLLLTSPPDSAAKPAGTAPIPDASAALIKAADPEDTKATDGSAVDKQPSPAITAATSEPDVQKGFGAPLWVLLMSVLGCSILTVSLIVDEIGNPPRPEQIRERIQKVVRHQYFILFSPVGAVFVYQMLLVADAAHNNLTVALAALGSGVTINSLLNVAIQHSKELFDGSRSHKGAAG